jgi:hypothetical protein
MGYPQDLFDDSREQYRCSSVYQVHGMASEATNERRSLRPYSNMVQTERPLRHVSYRGLRLCVVMLTCFILSSSCGTNVMVSPSMKTSSQSKRRNQSEKLFVGLAEPILKPEQRYMLRSSVGVRCNNDCRHLFHFCFRWNTFRGVSDRIRSLYDPRLLEGGNQLICSAQNLDSTRDIHSVSESRNGT